MRKKNIFELATIAPISLLIVIAIRTQYRELSIIIVCFLVLIYLTMKRIVSESRILRKHLIEMVGWIDTQESALDILMDSLVRSSGILEELDAERIEKASQSDEYLLSIKAQVKEKIFPGKDQSEKLVDNTTNAILSYFCECEGIENDNIYF